MILLHETDQIEQVELVETLVMPSAPNHDLLPDNPLSKIPTLVLEDGSALFDSPVICEFFDGQHQRQRLIPMDGSQRFKVLRWQALGDGLIDLLLAWRGEMARSDESRSEVLLAAFGTKAAASLDALKSEAGALEQSPFGIGHIAIGSALGYIDFRIPDLDWRLGRPALESWYRSFCDRPSAQATVLTDG